MKLRTIGFAAIAALALAGSAQAQEAGWDTKYGVLFTLPNPFNGHATGDNSVIDSYDGLVGFQYNLGPQTALRVGADLLRASCGTLTTKTGGVEFKDVCVSIPGPFVGAPTSGYNSHVGITLTGEYLTRMSTAAVAPYLGVGASVGFDRYALSGEDEVAGSKVYEYKNRAYLFDLGVGAKAGLEWRIHKVLALFAEYQAGLTLIQGSSNKIDEQATGSAAITGESSRWTFINLDTGLAHVGKLGLVAYF